VQEMKLAFPDLTISVLLEYKITIFCQEEQQMGGIL
jgi:hypothetical protein